jgi:hypothetical protein
MCLPHSLYMHMTPQEQRSLTVGRIVLLRRILAVATTEWFCPLCPLPLFMHSSSHTGEDTIGSAQGYIDPSADTVEDTIGNVQGYVEPSADTGQVTIASRVPA